MHVTDTKIRLVDVTLTRRGRPIFRELQHDFQGFPLVLLGPNGAGKSTLFGLFSGALRPRSGRVSIESPVGNFDTIRELRQHVGLVPQSSTGLRGLSVVELVAYSGWLKGMTRRGAEAAALHVVDMLNLSSLSSVSSMHVSGGEARRMMIAAALVANPQIVLFDEPTTGLDPAQRANVLDVIQTIAENRPVIVSTHEVDDIETRFSRLAVLAQGHVVFDDSVQNFLDVSQSNLTGRARAADAYQKVLESIRA